MTPREAVAYLETYLAGVADVETWKAASRRSDEAAERWRQGCYLAQGEAAKAVKERDSARLLLKDEKARADALGVAAEAWQERVTSAEANRNATIVAARQAEQRAKDAEARAANAEARAEAAEKLADGRCCRGAGAACQAEETINRLRRERGDAIAALKVATAEIERLKAEVGRVTLELRGRPCCGDGACVVAADRAAAGAEAEAERRRVEAVTAELAEAWWQNHLLAMAGPRGAVVISVDVGGCGQCGFPTSACVCSCWGVE